MLCSRRKEVLCLYRINVTLFSPTVHSYYRYGMWDGSHCASTTLTSEGRVFTNSYELTIVSVTVQTVRGKYDPASGRLRLANGLVGTYHDRIMVDDALGTFVWKTTDIACPDRLSEVFPKQTQPSYACLET